MKKQIHILTPRHHEHLGKLGIPWLRPPHIMATEQEYQEAYQAWKETHPQASHEFLHMKALGHIAWRQHATEQSRPVEVKQEKRKEWLLYAVIVLIVILLCVPHAHCQFSKINSIQTKNAGSSVGFHASPFAINCSTNMTCADDGSTLTLSSSGGGAPTGYQTLQNAAVSIAQETTLNWTAGIICVDNAGATRSDCALANITAVSHKFFNSVVSGGLVSAQPAFGDLSGSAACSQQPALTGDVTSSAGACATTNVNLPDGVTQAGSLLVTDIAAPASPAAAHLKIFGDSTDLRFHDKNAAGTIGTTVVANTLAANNFISAISAAGVVSGSRPACATLSDSGAFCNGTAYSSLTGVPSTFAPTAHNLLSASHGDTIAASAVRGDGLFAIGASPTWQHLAHSSATGGYFKWNGTDIVASAGAAAGTGSCTNQVVTVENADAAPTCTSITSAFLPVPGAASLGGVDSKDCTGTGHILSINTDGSVTCSADAGGSADPNDDTYVSFRDDFGHRAQASGNIGQLGWGLTAITSCGTVIGSAGSYPHLGIDSVGPPGTNGDGCVLWLSVFGGSTGTVGDLADNTNWEYKYIFQLSTATSISFLIGVSDSTTAIAPTNFIGLRFDTTVPDTDFSFVTTKASASDTSVDSGIAGDANWHKITVSSTTVGEIRFKLDSGSVFCISTAASGTGCAAGSVFNATHLPVVAVLPYMGIVTRAASAQHVLLDFFAFKATGLSR